MAKTDNLHARTMDATSASFHKDARFQLNIINSQKADGNYYIKKITIQMSTRRKRSARSASPQRKGDSDVRERDYPIREELFVPSSHLGLVMLDEAPALFDNYIKQQLSAILNEPNPVALIMEYMPILCKQCKRTRVDIDLATNCDDDSITVFNNLNCRSYSY